MLFTVDQWRDDLEYMAEEVVRRHPNPFHYGASEQEYRRAVADLRSRIPELSDARIALGIIGIHALLRDAHSEPEWLRIDPRLLRWGHYPIQLMLGANGTFVSAATASHVDLLGHHVTHIGSVETEEAYRRVRPYVSADNELNRSTIGTGLMTVPHLLELLGIAEDSRGVTVRFVSPDGQPHSRRLTPVDGEPAWIDASERAESPLPLWLSDPDSPYWWEYLESERLMYMQLNQMRNDRNDPFREFVERLFQFMDERPVEKFVIDLRHNRGGTNSVYWPLIHRIAVSAVNESGRFFVIAGRGTRSAATSFVGQLEQLTNVVLIGEPTAGRPHGHGAPSLITLPNSRIQLRISGLFVTPTVVPDHRAWIPPDVSAQVTARAYATNQDLALEAILRYQPTANFLAWLGPDWADDVPGVAARYVTYRAVPGNRWRDLNANFNAMGQALIEDGRTADAVAMLELAVSEYPDRWRGFHLLGTAYLEERRHAEAEAMFCRSFLLNRMNVEALRRLDAIRSAPHAPRARPSRRSSPCGPATARAGPDPSISRPS